MSAWPGHSDNEIWDIVAFLNKLPNMGEQDYGNLVKDSLDVGGHKAHSEDCAPQHRAAGYAGGSCRMENIRIMPRDEYPNSPGAREK
jgi:hypothetical protein